MTSLSSVCDARRLKVGFLPQTIMSFLSESLSASVVANQMVLKFKELSHFEAQMQAKNTGREDRILGSYKLL
jgi:hypothetical protein